MAIVVYDSSNGTYLKLTEDTYIVDIKDCFDEHELQAAAVVDGFPVSPETARELYEYAMQKHESA